MLLFSRYIFILTDCSVGLLESSCRFAVVAEQSFPREARKRDRRDPARSAAEEAEEAARRLPAGSFALCESEATATNVLSARKRSVSGKAPSQNGNQLPRYGDEP